MACLGSPLELFVKMTLGFLPCGFPHYTTVISTSSSWAGMVETVEFELLLLVRFCDARGREN